MFELCRRLTKDFEVTVIAPDARGARRGSWDGLQVIRYRYAPRRWESLTGGSGILANLRQQPWRLLLVPMLLAGQALALRRLRRQFDLVHAHWLIPQGLVAVLAAPELPLVCTSHGADVFALRGSPWEWLRRRVAWRSALLTAVGSPLAQALRQLSPTPVRELPMGVDLQRFGPKDDVDADSDRLLFVGRLVPKKGADRLISAFAELAKVRPRLQLQMVGDGPERIRLEAAVAGAGLGARVQFLGAQPNAELPDFYRRARVVVLPFRTASDGDAEGLGLTLIEALACGCHVVAGESEAQNGIAARCPGFWRCDVDQTGALAVAIAQALDTPASPQRLREQREALLSPYDWSAVAGRYADALRDGFSRRTPLQ